MTPQAITSEFPNPFVPGNLSKPAIVALALVPCADYLLFDQKIGLSLFLFALLLAIGSAVARGTLAAPSIPFLLLALLPLVENVGPLSIGFAVFGLIGFALASLRPGPIHFLWFAGTGISWLYRDLYAATIRNHPAPATPISWSGRLLPWLVPTVLCSIFLWLFSSANPLIEAGLAALNPMTAVSQIDFGRLLFWLSVLSLVWPFVRPRLHRKLPTPTATAATTPADGWIGLVLGPASILRSLVLFNGLFAIQSVLDIVYLWNGNTLPDHLSFAAYAHRGAYPLVATALLAGVFLIAATRKGGAAERSGLIRLLIHLWTAQNLLLVASSMLRLDLYVAAYSLTYLRFAAFIWMLLTAGGLVLILLRMMFDKSNGWLIAANLVNLAAVLYVSAFVDFPEIVADYNVRHSYEMSGSGTHLDLDYLASLGPMALPAFDAYLVGVPAKPPIFTEVCQDRDMLVDTIRNDRSDWRAWSLRRWRLDRYLTSPRVATAQRQCAQAQ